MNGSALFVLILVGLIVWGGFGAALYMAMKKEKGKTDSNKPSAG